VLICSCVRCPVPDPKSRVEERCKLKIGRKEAHDTGDLLPSLRDQRVKVTRLVNAETGNQPHLWNRKAYGWSMMTHITDGCSDQPESSEWLFKSPLAGGGGHIVVALLQAAQLFGQFR